MLTVFTACCDMAVTAIDLNLEGEDLVFYSGQRVKGALVLQISVPVIIAGKLKVTWVCMYVMLSDDLLRRNSW